MARRKRSARLAIHVPGVWSAVAREIRDRSSTAIWQYLEDPRLMLTLKQSEYSALAERSQTEAEETYSDRLADPRPVTVGYALLRAHVPKDLLRQYRDVEEITVFPDDTIEPVERLEA